MKASTVLASLLFGSFAAAAPVNKRDLVYKTEIVYETVVVYTTVYDDGSSTATPSATPTSTPAAFYEQQEPTTSSAPAVYPVSTPAAAASTSSAAPAYTPPVVEEPSSSATPTPTPSSEPAYTPAPVSSAPAATSTAAAPTSTAAAATSAPATSEYTTSSSSSATYQDVDITVYDNTGAAGACGESLTDDMMVVAISKGAWNAKGGSTYNVMTGASSNPWCGTQIQIDYNGATATAKIMDMCPGCTGENDIDLSRGVWKALGITEDTRLQASWSVV